MSKMLWNPTGDKLSYQFSGITYFFEPGERKKVEDPCGQHLLHNIGMRGLTVLEYGCDEEKLKKDAIERNKDFKRRMVIDYNQRNETRKQTNFAYLAPTTEIKKYAIELGVGLLEPFSPRDQEHEEMAAMKSENNILKGSLNDLTARLATLTELVMEQKTTARQGGKSG